MRLEDKDIKTREVTQWRGLHLFHFDMSSCSQKVRIVFRELGLPFTPHPINLMKDEQQTDWYLGINPRGEVPVLVHNGAVHTESNDIIQYIDENFASSEKSLLPQSGSERQAMQALLDLENDLHGDLRTVTFTYLAPDLKNRTGDKDSLDFIGRFHNAFQALDERLSDSAYLLGDRLTLLDISWFITLFRLERAGYPLAQHPRLAAYFLRISRRPSFQREIHAGALPMRFVGAAYRRFSRLIRGSLARDYQRWKSQS
ncbi:MAG: glutathione S-transferase family protein [Luminiphilus sp.]|nr:glutathione S-transferase family protein [Luminiphilus sp.]